MAIPFHFEPALQLDLEAPLRVEVLVRLDLLPLFHPSIKPISYPGNIKDIFSPQNPLEEVKPAALTVAKLVSNAMFGSTTAIHQPFLPVGFWGKDGTLEGVIIFLNHRLGFDDVGLNPEYILVFVEESQGKLILQPEVLTGERRRQHNEKFEGPGWSGPEIALL